MNNRRWLRLLLIALSLFVPARIASAQTSMPSRVWQNFFRSLPKQSHHDLPGGLDLDNPQEMMAERLRELHELRELQDQVAGLLKDPAFLKSIQKLSESQLGKLREKMLNGEGLGKDRNWEALLGQAESQHKLDQKQIGILRRWAKRAEEKSPSPSEPSSTGGQPPDKSTPPAAATPNAPKPAPSSRTKPEEPTFLDRMQEESTKWLMDHLDDVGGDVLEALTGMSQTDNGGPLADLLHSLNQADFSGMNLRGRAEGLSRYLPKVGDFLNSQRGTFNGMRSFFREAPVPSLSRIGGLSPSRPSVVTADSEGWTPALLSLLMLGTIVFLLCRMGTRLSVRASSGVEPWRLGPWPVSPRSVSTRQDVIRGFEYLVLLCLGPSAAACHHRELAERLAQQDSGNPKRRQAAEILAWLYEQARYSPDGESLSQEELSDARHALCCLAGVTAL